jgi:hypothetical protein
MLRDSLLDIDGVSEKVRFILPNWKWTWEYSVPVRRLCWLHVMETGVAGTFAISDEDERPLERAKPAGVIVSAVRDAQRTGPVRWCSVDFTDRKSIDAFLGFMRKKVAWVLAAPQDSRVFRRKSVG